MTASRLICALDTADLRQATAWANLVMPHCGLVKIGLELFSAHGPAAIASMAAPVFLDLKLHDIPATVAGAVCALSALHPHMLTVHAAGGPAMIAAAREQAERAPGPRISLIAVTVLTSLDDAALTAAGVADGAPAQVARLARLALNAGADGLVCSGHEVALLRDMFGPAPILVVPGIRPPGAPDADQVRISTPHAAIAAGASYIVVGRPITGAPDPAQAAAAIAAQAMG